MTLAAGDYFPGAHIERAKAGSTVAIAKGLLLKWDRSGDGWITTSAAADELGPFAVAVEAMATGGTQVTVCTRGYVAVTADEVLEPNDLVQASDSTAGQVDKFVTATIDAAATDDIKRARDEDARKVGRYITDNEDLGDGVLAVDAADGDVVIIDLGSVGVGA